MQLAPPLRRKGWTLVSTQARLLYFNASIHVCSQPMLNEVGVTTIANNVYAHARHPWNVEMINLLCNSERYG